MIAHKDAASTRRNIFKSADIDLYSSRSGSCIGNPHRNPVEPRNVSNQQLVRNSDDPGDRAKSEIDKGKLEGREHTIFKDTVVARNQPIYALNVRLAIAFGSFP